MTAVPLPSLLDTAAAPGLRQELLARLDAHEPVLLEGAGVTRAGQACLQVLASASATAAARDLAFAITNPSDALVDMAALAGLDTMLGLAA